MNLYRIMLVSALLIWFGSVLSISFMEAPLKFTAPEISVRRGLGIGKVVFHALNKMEWLFALTGMVSILFLRPQKKVFILFMAALLILLFQTFILFPQLDERADLILTGKTPSASWHHLTYIVAEGLKLIVLLFTAIIYLNQNLKTYDSSGSARVG